jgi:hypothetical protein
MLVLHHSAGCPEFRAIRGSTAAKLRHPTWQDSSCPGGECLLILLIVLLVLAVGVAPAWPYSRGWGYYPSGGLGLILVIVLILLLMRGGL